MSKIPEGNNLIPTLIVANAAEAIKLYVHAFGAQEQYRMPTDAGKIMHACLSVGNCKFFLCDVMPEMGCSTASNSAFYLYVENVDDASKQAKKAGLQEMQAPQDMFWGDRTCNLKDPFGITWTLATHLRDVMPQEIEEGRKAFMATMKAKAA